MRSSTGGDGATRRPRIVDFSTHLSGPLASHLLAETGADVLKVENPRAGDGNRGLRPLIADRGMFHAALNSGARSLTWSPRSPHWNDIVEACARWADAVIVGARPLDARKRSLDFASIARANPQIVYCLVSGFGEQGPWKDITAHGQTVDGFAGLVQTEWRDGTPITRPGWRSAGAPLAGVFAALGVMTALYRREAGQGGAQFVSVSLWESAMWWSWRDLNSYANLGHGWNEYSALGSRYAMYGTADDRAVLCCPIERKFWERFCDLLDLPEEWKERGSWEASGMEFGVDHDDESRLIAERMRTRALAEWVPLLSEQEIPFAPILTIQEALDSEHAEANGIMRRVVVNGQEVQIAASPVRLDSDPDPEAPDASLAELRPAPELGEHTREILTELGLSELADES